MEARMIEMAVSPDESGNKLTAQQATLGYAGEHLATQLQFKFPKTWSENDSLRFYVSLLAANGKAYKTELQEWPVTVLLPAAVTYEGSLYIQVAAVPVGDEALEVKKSSCFKGTIEKSLGGVQSLPEDAAAGLLEQSLKDFYAAMQKLDETAKSLPYIGDNGNWYVYNPDLNTYEDTQKSALPESFATLDQQYAGTAVISTVNTFKMDEKQILPGSKVILTMTDGSDAARFIRTDGNPLYYYGTDKVVEALGFDVPIEVAAEDLIAGIRVYSGGAYTIKYQTAPSKVFFDYADGAAENAADAAAEKARRELAEQYGPYWNNQVAGKASGATAEISGAAAGTGIKSLIISGRTSVGAGAAEGQADAYPAAPSKVYMCGTNLLKLKQDTRTAGGLTMSCDGDLISISGTCKGTNLYVLEKLTRFDVPFTLHVQVLTGSSTGAGMYFDSTNLIAFKTLTKYFPNGTANWKGSPRWITDSTVFTDDFTCRIWATPGNTPDMPYEPYREQEILLPEGLSLYGTPDGFRDTYDVVSGLLTSRCTKLLLASGWFFSYSTEGETVTWITNQYYTERKQYYLVHDGTVTTHTTDWQGKISMTVNKSDVGINAEDTLESATRKAREYFASSYAILPLKQPATEQLMPASVCLPSGNATVLADQGDTEAVFCRDINGAYLNLLEYTTSLEARIAQLESGV